MVSESTRGEPSSESWRCRYAHKTSRFFGASMLCLWVLIAFATRARAEPVERPPSTETTLARLIQQSLSARPELARAEANVRASAERAPQQTVLPDPMLQVGIQNDGFTSFEVGRADTSYVSVMASQTLPWPGKLDLQARQAELSVVEAKQGLARARLSTEAEVRRAHLDLVLVRRLLFVIDQLEATWQVASSVARVQYQSGTGAQADVLRAELSLQRLKQRRIALRAQEASRVQALNRLRNHPLDEPIATAQPLEALPALEASVSAFSPERALARSPELANARLGITRAEQASAIAERSGYPDFTIGAGVMFRGALPPMWQVTLGAPVPLFSGSRRSHAASESRAMRAASTNQIAELEQLIRWKSKERETAFAALRDRVTSYQQGLLPVSKAAAENALIQYRAGKASFGAVLEANSSYLADEEEALAAIGAAHRLLIAEAEIDLGPTPMPESSAATQAAGASGMGP